MSDKNQDKINEAVSKYKNKKTSAKKVGIKPMNSSIFNKSKEVLDINKRKND